ncbi:MAG: aminotransferase class I/II-fold pyridoxal phosphate-dependent enzyme [Lachnospiraceae bacterium]|nr:aminotransferase class I/II-fold pyridoxal phosphate-dependent enzyme [Lachnospiraceae bacterium]
MRHGGDIYRNRVELDFSVNLNPKPVPASVLSALQEGMRQAGAYPDPEQERVREALALADGAERECVFAGNGASELLMASVRAFHPRAALLFEPCYSGYRYALSSLPDCEIREAYLAEDSGFAPTEDLLFTKAGEDWPEGGMLFLTDPWNPSGINLDDALLCRILELAAFRGITVILDQSFYTLSEKCGRSRGEKPGFSDRAGELTGRFGNLVILRSYTKLFSLPGIRMGYVISCGENIRRIRRQLPEWNLSSAAACAMEACAELTRRSGYEVFDAAEIREEREYLTRELTDLGFRVYGSDTVFLLFRAEPDLGSRLLSRGILIRDCAAWPGLGRGYYRIAVKSRGENRLLIENIRKIQKGDCSA